MYLDCCRVPLRCCNRVFSSPLALIRLLHHPLEVWGVNVLPKRGIALLAQPRLALFSG